MGADQSTPTGSSGLSLLTSTTKATTGSPKEPKSKIIIVNKGPGGAKERDLTLDRNMTKLATIPQFYPLLKSSIRQDGREIPENISPIDYHPVYYLCQRYQNHLAYCAELVSGEQNSLSVRVKELDQAIGSTVSMISDRQRKNEKQSVEVTKIGEITAHLKQIDQLLPAVIDLAKAINDLLPANLQLDPLNLDPSSHQTKMLLLESATEQTVLDANVINPVVTITSNDVDDVEKPLDRLGSLPEAELDKK